MKIITRSVMRWVGDELVTVEEESYEYDGPVAEAKGGNGGNDQYYENLNRLYGIQADQAELLGNAFKENVLPGYKQWGEQVQGINSQANREKAAGDAAAQVRASTTQNMQDVEANMASLGINPSDQGFQRQMRIASIQGAGMEAGSATQARNQREQLGLAATQDWVTAGMGTPTQATQATNSAISATNSAISGRNQEAGNQGAAVGNIVRGGIGLMYGPGGGGWKDGGVVRLENGGYVHRLAMGGMAGGMKAFGGAGAAPPPAPAPQGAPAPKTGDVAAGAAGTAGMGLAGVGKAGSLVKGVGDLTGSSTLSSFGTGMNLAPAQAQAAGEAYRQAATQMVDGAIGSVVPEAGAAAGATEGAAAAGTAAELTGTAAALEGGAALASTLGAAVPVIGAGVAAYGLGSALGWWADGGKVTPGAVQRTGEVDGPGGPKDDLIPAMLSDGEYVMPVGAVKFFGLDRLEKMRQKGLDYEKQLGIGRA